MHAALRLAARGLGNVAPNPAVGCIIVNREGHVAGRGWTAPGGRPHAETQAILRAGKNCEGGTAYVTLEPCSHQGKTPPCSKALIKSGIARVVVACMDPDPRVSGKGIRNLQKAGIEVQTGILHEQAMKLNAGFFLKIDKGRPLFTLKTATSLDGRIATHTGSSQWITDTQARQRGHYLRATHDAILVGIGTALADDPSLSCRLPGMEGQSPVRLVADTALRLPPSSQMAETAHQVRTVVLCSADADKTAVRALKDKGVEVKTLETRISGRVPPETLAKAMGELGLTRVLLEGGGKIAGEFLAAGLIDRLAWFHAPKLIGGDGMPAIAAFGTEKIDDSAVFERSSLAETGPDLYETYEHTEAD